MIAANNVKFCIDIDDKHTYVLRVKSCLQLQILPRQEVISGKYNMAEICASGSYNIQRYGSLNCTIIYICC
jgi:hypothetical protein